MGKQRRESSSSTDARPGDNREADELVNVNDHEKNGGKAYGPRKDKRVITQFEKRQRDARAGEEADGVLSGKRSKTNFNSSSVLSERNDARHAKKTKHQRASTDFEESKPRVAIETCDSSDTSGMSDSDSSLRSLVVKDTKQLPTKAEKAARSMADSRRSAKAIFVTDPHGLSDDDTSTKDSADLVDDDKLAEISLKMLNNITRKSPKSQQDALPATFASDGKRNVNSDASKNLQYLQKEIEKLECLKKLAELESESPSRGINSTSTVLSANSVGSHALRPRFKRVDNVWDQATYGYRIRESTKNDGIDTSGHAFLVRRTFSHENEHIGTIVDIKSKELRAVLRGVMKDCKRVSLDPDEPHIDPNVLFIYLEDFRLHYRKTLKDKIRSTREEKKVKKLEVQKRECKLLVGYIDTDYGDVQKELRPLLAAGKITFDLLWALFDPRDTAITSCYGDWSEPRCLIPERCNRYSSMQEGDFYKIEGTCKGFDGKNFGECDISIAIPSFNGAKKISSLSIYPLKFHNDPDKVRRELCERGKRFVDLAGMYYKFHKGVAYQKGKKGVSKIHNNCRVMVDSATFIRINPNYKILQARGSKGRSRSSGHDSDNDSDAVLQGLSSSGQGPHVSKMPKYRYRVVEDDDGKSLYAAYQVDDDCRPVDGDDDATLLDNEALRHLRFSEEELLIFPPVVLGFSFNEKLWLEFSVSGIKEIEWNEQAFESLVLPEDHKKTIQALVRSHKFHSAETIDDVIVGKGKGLVALLHGPPGVGKTLTAEGVAEFLRCPLYSVSVGELGTDPARLEVELQKILDVAHCWSAVLLLDEADVFLEARQSQDLVRNGLVSIFLRLLEYFQGTMFLTTNRVNTFDEAFASRVHIGLRYGELTPKARNKIWHTFIEKCSAKDVSKVLPPTEEQYIELARKPLNGRQIKNMVRTAQALALEEDAVMSLGHIKRVIDVAENFAMDMKGGSGYSEAMRSYT